MLEDMSMQYVLACKSPVAHVTFVWTREVMAAYVAVEMFFATEGFGAARKLAADSGW